jgi:predicted dithiol-disulfide oxidoreductase (DUF899 family)
MTDYKTGTNEQWLADRLELLDAEKELTRIWLVTGELGT